MWRSDLNSETCSGSQASDLGRVPCPRETPSQDPPGSKYVVEVHGFDLVRASSTEKNMFERDRVQGTTSGICCKCSGSRALAMRRDMHRSSSSIMKGNYSFPPFLVSQLPSAID